MTSPILAPGYEFTHKSYIDAAWKPGPGETYADAPKARMVVTKVTRRTVYFSYAPATRGSFTLDRATFEARYVR